MRKISKASEASGSYLSSIYRFLFAAIFTFALSFPSLHVYGHIHSDDSKAQISNASHEAVCSLCQLAHSTGGMALASPAATEIPISKPNKIVATAVVADTFSFHTTASSRAPPRA